MREAETICPKCGRGTIKHFDSQVAPPEKGYNEFQGGPGVRTTRYWCTRGCTWVERE